MSDASIPEQASARELIAWGTRQLARARLYYGHGTQSAEDDAIQLVLHAAGLDYDSDESALDLPLADSQRCNAVALIERRINERIPAPYLTGVAYYAGLKFAVDERVLVPRSSIIELIEGGFQPWLGDQEPQRILDLCTGSACLAILCALAYPQAQVDASDISDGALAVAAVNVKQHGVQSRVKLLRSDVFEALHGRHYDLIISNPPYVGAMEMQGLPAEYRHEPALALASEEDGLLIVRRILEEATEQLAEQGWLIVEVGNSEDAVARRWPDLPLTWVEFERSEGGVFIINAQELREWRSKAA